MYMHKKNNVIHMLIGSWVIVIACYQQPATTHPLPTQTQTLPVNTSTERQSTEFNDEAVDKTDNRLEARISTPQGFIRTEVPTSSYGYWLRQLALKAGTPPVHLYNGQLKGNQTAHAAVFDIDTGDEDLQQCADAVMRLRAEYLFSRNLYNDISFNFTNGTPCPFSRWAAGERPVITAGNKVAWQRKGKQGDFSYKNFRQYLNTVFRYAGTASLSKSLHAVPLQQLQAGDVFIKGGFPGHAVIVVDVATAANSDEKVFLLAQSYMPAQEIQLLRNPNDTNLSPWYRLSDITGELITPEWTFSPNMLKRF